MYKVRQEIGVSIKNKSGYSTRRRYKGLGEGNETIGGMINK